MDSNDRLTVAELADLLRASIRGAVDGSTRRCAEYSSDASNYRVLPQVVVEPFDIADVEAVLAIGRDSGVPVTSRGGGTSVAGNAVGAGVVIDFARHVNRILDIDTASRTATVEPGVILSTLQERVRSAGLRFGPDPSTHARATLGGMIGNNACGPHAIAYGRTADNVQALTVIDGRGRRHSTRDGLSAIPGLPDLVSSHLQIIRTELGRFPRQVSGYSLEHLLPERGADLAKALVGSEGTLVTVLEATVSLVPVSPARLLVVLGYPDMPTAADAVPALLAHRPDALEGLDARLVDVVRRANGGSSLAGSAVPDLPRGGGWLMIEVGGEDTAVAHLKAEALLRDAGALEARVLPAGAEATAIWRIREDGAGLAGRTQQNRQAWPGWEDAAVPPAQLGSYLREFDTLLADYGLTGFPYGHFGDGCVHVRLDLPLERPDQRFRDFLFDAATLAVSHGGSCSGEHGDGRARSELLPLMYSAAAIDLFGAVKSLFDPRDLLNPGVLVRPRPLDADLRRPQALPIVAAGGFRFTRDAGDFTTAVHRCVGVGKCRADSSAAGGFMCPSYLASMDEKDVTRGRARVLQELTNGSLVTDWSSSAVHESLDLCLSCKACASDCPAGVDMAQYKSEVLYRRFRHRIRPMTHYTLGWLPRWLAALDRFPWLGPAANAVLRSRRLAAPLRRLAGIDRRRTIPHLTARSFRRSSRPTRSRTRSLTGGPAPARPGTPVLLWVDTFTNAMAPAAAQAAVAVLEDAGFQVLTPDRRICCGLTWITTGQLGAAKNRLRQLLDVLAPHVDRGLTIVGLEPSCTAVLRSDLLELLPDDPRAAQVSAAVRTLAQTLTALPGWRPPDLGGLDVVVQPHCHHHAVLGHETDRQLLATTGAAATTIAGCCGMAGNFGMERGHYEMSVAVAGNALLPALRAAPPEATVLADGFSCRTQIEQLTGRPAVTLAQLLASRLDAALPAETAGTVPT